MIFIASASMALWVLIGFFIVAMADAEGLDHLNQRINTSIRYCSDPRYGGCVPAKAPFTPYLSVGDCHTYASTKREELIKRGISPQRLILWEAAVRSPNPNHAVLIMDGHIVFDNRWPDTEEMAVLTKFEGYRFLRPVPAEELTGTTPE